MSGSSAPWRAIEDAAGPAGPAIQAERVDGLDGPPGRVAGERASAVRTPWLVAGIGLTGVLIAAAIILVLTGGSGSVVVSGDAIADRGGSSEPASGRGSIGADLVVDVQGAVRRPGIVRLPVGSRVADAIDRAGGYSGRVAAERVSQALNLAALLEDGGQVVVPSRDDPTPSSGPVGGGGSVGGTGGGSGGSALVDLNAASATELDALPGIGPVTAAKIIAAREEQRFTAVADLGTRKVVGAATLEKIKDLVVVR
jgi:competence protein ComEA